MSILIPTTVKKQVPLTTQWITMQVTGTTIQTVKTHPRNWVGLASAAVKILQHQSLPTYTQMILLIS